MLRLAYDYSTKHEYEKADTLLLNILQKKPGYALAVYLRGIVMIEQFQFPEAVELFKDILLDNENNHRALLFLSRIYFVYDHQQSLKYAKKATKAADDFFMELNTLAEEYEPLNFMFYKLWENMVAEFDTKFEADPAAASLEIMKYLISTPLKIELCKNALKSHNPSDPQKMQELLERMGMLYTEVGMHEEAIDTYKTLIETTPTYGRGYILLADRLIKTDNLTPIDELYDDIQKQQGLEIEKDIVDALVQYKRGRIDYALKKLQKIHSKDYKLILNHIMGMLYENSGDSQNALKTYKKIHKKHFHKESTNFYYWCATSYEVEKSISFMKD